MEDTQKCKATAPLTRLLHDDANAGALDVQVRQSARGLVGEVGNRVVDGVLRVGRDTRGDRVHSVGQRRGSANTPQQSHTTQ